MTRQVKFSFTLVQLYQAGLDVGKLNLTPAFVVRAHVKKFKCELQFTFVCVKQSSASSDEDERFILNNKRPLTPLVLSSVHVTSSLDVFAPSYEQTVDMEVEPIPRLPTPEERMRQQAEAVGADIVPINVTGRERLRSRF